MATSSDYKAYILERLAPLQPVRTRSMFGGVGLFSDEAGGMFAFITSGDELFFKVDEHNRPDFEAAGAERFHQMPYYVPSTNVL